MNDDSATVRESSGDRQALPEHPKGTLAICLVYGVLFVVGWFAFYFTVFLPRGPVR